MSYKHIKQLHYWKYGKLFLIVLLLCGLTSCRKFLDEQQKSGFSLINTTKACLQVLDYTGTYSGFPLDGLASSDEYYLADADFNALDEENRKIYVWDPEIARIAGGDWLNIYKKIYTVNVVMESLDEIARKEKSQENTADFKFSRGFSLFMRGYYFFSVAQIYAPPYKRGTANDALSVPLRYTSDINEVSVRSTVKETYDRIIKDVNDAIPLLPEISFIPTRPDKSTAYGLLARVYLAMGEYEKAGEAANTCLSLNGNSSRLLNYNDLSQTSITPFIRFSKEVLFHTVNYLRVANRRIDPDLYNSYDSQDLRKVIFFKQNTGNAAGTYYFSGNYEPSNSSYFTGIGIDEIYLIRAESYARANKKEEAMADLNTLLKTRWSGVYANRTASDADDALTQVLTERRKELVMRDLRWSDLRRLNLEPKYAITLKRKVGDKEYLLPPNDNRYVLLIPQDVMKYSSMPQNPR